LAGQLVKSFSHCKVGAITIQKHYTILEKSYMIHAFHDVALH